MTISRTIWELAIEAACEIAGERESNEGCAVTFAIEQTERRLRDFEQLVGHDQSGTVARRLELANESRVIFAELSSFPNKGVKGMSAAEVALVVDASSALTMALIDLAKKVHLYRNPPYLAKEHRDPLEVPERFPALRLIAPDDE